MCYNEKMKIRLLLFLTFLIPIISLTATGYNRGIFWSLFFAATQSPKQQQKSTPPEDRPLPPKDIRPKSKPIEVSREDVKKEIDRQINGYMDERGKYVEGIKEQVKNMREGYR